MKVSVLLPTRNRLEYLKYAVETVRRQDYDDWEIVISDNDSTDNIRGWVRSLRENRIKYVRSERFLAVTDNWNNALDHCTGDFVIMLGDDDGLMKGYFRRAHELVEQFPTPDLIYTSGYLYAYPGVLPDHPEGLLNHYRNASFLQTPRDPFWLPTQQARQLVRDSLNFKMKFTYNMQYSLIGRPLIDDMLADGRFFQSPFPDYYATNVMFLKAKRILIDPEPMVAVGITPKSYGFYLFNNREADGINFLQAGAPDTSGLPAGHELLPGTNMNNSWLLAMEQVARNYRLRVGYGRYRRLQIVHVLRGHVDRTIPDDVYLRVKQSMNLGEKVFYSGGLFLVSVAMRVLSGGPRRRFRRAVRVLEKWLRASNEWTPPPTRNAYANMIEVFEGVGAGTADGRPGLGGS